MEDASFICRSDQLPLGRGLRNDIHFSRHNDPVDAQSRQLTLRASLVIEQVHSCCRINLAVNRGVEFTSDSSGPDWAITIDETQSSPQRCTPGTHNLSNRLRFFLDPVCLLRPGIDAEVKALWIERRGFKQLLR